MKMKGWPIFVGAYVVILGISPAWAAKNSIVVPRDYTTIQAAIDAAAPGATIKVNPGTYTEELVIAKDLTLKGAGVGNTIIQAPEALTPFAKQFGRPVVRMVRITDGAYVKISNLTVSGPLPCAPLGGGINVMKDATLDLKDAHVTRMRPEGAPCSSALANGRAVVLGLPPNIVFDDGSGSGAIGHGTITNVTVDRYHNVGITVVGTAGGPPSIASFTENLVIGGESPLAPVNQTGILVSAASIAEVKENTVIGNICSGFPFCGPNPINQSQGKGIFNQLLSEGISEISENFISGNDVGIYHLASSDHATISENQLEDNLYFGIVIQDGDGTTSENKIVGGEVGIAVVAGLANAVGTLHEDEILETTVEPVQEIECCGFAATAIVEDN